MTTGCFVTKKVSDLIPYANNSRTHTEHQVSQVAASIKEFGFLNPVIINSDNMIIAGHCRFQAAIRLKLIELPCVLVEHLSPLQVKAYIIADNKLAENAGWDEDLLRIELALLQEQDFNLDLIGFDQDELDALLGQIEIDLKDADEIPETPVEAITKLGDLWLLGDHRLLCGDSTDHENIKRILDGNNIDLVFTDPPYRMDVEGGINQFVGKAAAKLGEAIKHLCDFDPVKFLDAIPTVFDKKMNSYIFCNKDLVPDYLNWAIKNNYFFNILFWKKPTAIPLGKQHRPDVEYLLVFRKKAHWNDGLKDVNYSKCLEYGREKGLHPTMKPVEMIVNEIKISSPTKGLVFDFFGGSGSTLIACEKSQRKCYMMELQPEYCDVIVKRWENLTGLKAKLELMD